MKPGLEFPICCQTGPSLLATLWLMLHTLAELLLKTGSGGASGAAGDSEKEAPWPVCTRSSPEGHRRSPKTQQPPASSPPHPPQHFGSEGGQRGRDPGQTERPGTGAGTHPTLAPSAASLEGGKG